MKFSKILGLLIVLASSVNGQITWTIYNTGNSGIVNNNVFRIVFDNSGNLWCATQNGLSKFNGLTWTTYDEQNSPLPSDWVTALRYDSISNLLWVGTGNGLASFDGTNWNLFTSMIAYQTIYDIEIDNAGNVWFGGFVMNSIPTGAGLTKYNGTTFYTYTTLNSGISDNMVYDVEIDSVGAVWAGTDDGVSKLDSSGWTVYDTLNSMIPGNVINSMDFDSAGHLWVGIRELQNLTLGEFDGTSWITYDSANSSLLPAYFPIITVDSKNNKWIGTRYQGILCLTQSGWSSYLPGSGIPAGYIEHIVEGPDGRIWAASVYGNGIGVLSLGSSLTEINNNENLPFPNPAVTVSEIKINIELMPDQIILYNIFGQPMSTDVEITGNSIFIHRNQLDAGIYFYRVFEKSILIDSGRIVFR